MRLMRMANPVAAGAIDRLVEGPTMRLVLAVAALVVAGTVNAEGWLCAADSAAGFQVNRVDGEWTAMTFRAEGKYVVRRPQDSDQERYRKAAWVVATLGTPVLLASCESNPNEYGHMGCSGLIDFQVNVKRLRFIVANNGSYLFTDDVIKKLKIPPSDVLIEIGRCTAL